MAVDNGTIVEYLIGGGLIEILKNHAGAKQVWIRENEDESLTYTFVEPDSGVGGQAVPWSLTESDKVFTPKQDDVKTFLQAFGLSRSESEDVINTVGTAP